LQPKSAPKKLFKNKQIGDALKVKCHEKAERWLRAAVTTAPPLNLSIDYANAMAKGDRRKDLGPGEVQSPPVSRILLGTLAGAAATIPLGRQLPADSSHLPAASPSRIIGRLFGVAPRRDCPFHPN